ncbi:MAG: prolipoprotein diacylglyceryl transferase [Gammaproteobacteria bacterium]|nr:prolipoprotein diacylglyceryl transferase [Gammaproteobacteria bacterium]
MIVHPNIDPVAIDIPLPWIGSLPVHWYGLMYLIGFVGGALIGVYRARRPGSGWKKEEVWDVLFYIAIGVIIGGRLGYVLFYQFEYYSSHPLEVFSVWTGGMAFHGGLIGVIVAVWLFGRHTQRKFLQITDFIAPLCPLGLGAGRVGNFLNQELWGGPTDAPWGVVFPAVDAVSRHPSQLYEAGLEGLVLLVILLVYSRRSRPVGSVSGLFLVCYSMFRFFVELFREPDTHLGYLMFDWVTMGQLLSVPMFVFGVWLMYRAYSGSAKVRSTVSR